MQECLSMTLVSNRDLKPNRSPPPFAFGADSGFSVLIDP